VASRNSKEVATDLVLGPHDRQPPRQRLRGSASRDAPGRNCAGLVDAAAADRPRVGRTDDAREIDLVTASAGRVAPALDAVSPTSTRGCSPHPGGEMFPADTVAKFAASIAAIVEAMPTRRLADRTGQLGGCTPHPVTAGQYSAVGAVLLETLAEADPGFDDATRAAWATAYDLLAESMQLAARG
jgi:hypothetical protein